MEIYFFDGSYAFAGLNTVHTNSLIRIKGKKKKKKKRKRITSIYTGGFERPRRVYVDIDGTLFDKEFRSLDDLGEPNHDIINTIKSMKNNGSHIVIWTARTNSNLNPDVPKDELIKRLSIQLEFHGIPFDEIEVSDKPHFDLLIDDKVTNSRRFMKPKELFPKSQ